MRFTARQLSETTITDMYRAMDRQHPVTITYLKEEKDEAGKKTGRMAETVRTIEIYDIRTTAAGHIILKAMDRETGEKRTFRTDRIVSYTTHRTAYVLTSPVDETPLVVPATVAELTAWEIARDDVSYWTAREYEAA